MLRLNRSIVAAFAATSTCGFVLACVSRPEPRIQIGPDAVVTADGLHRVENVPLGTLYIKPDYRFGSYDRFVVGDTGLSVKSGSRILTDAEAADVKRRFTRIATLTIGETGRREVSEPGPCVAEVNLGLLDMDLFDPTRDGGARTTVVDSFGAVTLVLEIRDAHTGEALLRYGRRRRLTGGVGTGGDPGRGPVLELAFHQFALDFQRDFERALPRIPPVARSLSCEQRAGLEAFDPASDAAQEMQEALALTPDLERGERIYETCVACHRSDGEGIPDGSVPRLTGQHRSVVIKQLADIRAGTRDNRTMYPFAYGSRLGGPQALADVAGYIGTLETSDDPGLGPGSDLALGDQLYGHYCAHCHGAQGEGNADGFVPRIQAQHYGYLARQASWIREGGRHNSSPEMEAQIQALSDSEMTAVLDYVSRLGADAGED